MRRRKGNRGRPRKVKKGRLPKVTKSVSLDTEVADDNSGDQTLSLKNDDAVPTAFIGLDKTGPSSYRVGSVNIELADSDEDIKPEILENDMVLEVECGSNTAKMHLSRLCQGSKGSCILFDGAWLTPNEFQFVSGRETAKDWKRSIRHFGRSLKLLITKGILTVHPAACRCDSCRLLTSSSAEPKVVKDKRERDVRDRGSRRSMESASGSDKEEGSRSSEDEASREAEDSPVSGQNGVDESGSGSEEEGEDDQEEEGNVEENNNVAEEKAESSSASGSSSSSSSDSSDSDSDSDEDDKKDEEEEEVEEEGEEKVVEEVKDDRNEGCSGEPTNLDPVPAEAAEEMEVDQEEDSKVEEEGLTEEEETETSENAKYTEPETMEADSEEQSKSPILDQDDKSNGSEQHDSGEAKIEDDDHYSNQESETEQNEEGTSTTLDNPVDVPENNEDNSPPEETLNTEESSNDDQTLADMKAAYNGTFEECPLKTSEETPYQERESSHCHMDTMSTSNVDSSPVDSPATANDAESLRVESTAPVKSSSEDKVDTLSAPILDEAGVNPQSVDRLDGLNLSSVDTSVQNNSPSVETMDTITSSGGDTEPSTREQSPALSKSSTPTLEIPMKKGGERTNSSGGKSRLSNIIDLLRTSKEKETQKAPVPERLEERPADRRKPDVNEIRQVKEARDSRDHRDAKVSSPLPPKREEAKSRKPEREQPIPKLSKVIPDETKLNHSLQDALRYPMGHLPFGFPPPDLLERASREAHEQLSKSHRQFEKNLESLIAQNMNPFIPELSIFSLPEHRAQLEYNYLKNMERLDQMAKERMASMAEIRHQQLLQEHNSFVAKLAEQQKAASKADVHDNHVKNHRDVHKKPAPPVRKPTKDNTPAHPKVPHAHRAVPDVRKDKPDNRTLQSPPAAHHHQPTSRPPSTGSKPPSSLPLPASSARATHPTGPSSTQSRSSPMIAPIAPPLQMWSSCFPYVIPPPNMEMQRLTQFFPNLNGGLFSPESGSRRNTDSPILDLSTKKRKMDHREDESRSKHAKMSSSSKSVHSSHHANGLPRESSRSHHSSSKDFSAKSKPSWASLERNSAIACTCALQHLNDIRNWSVDDVCCFLKGLEGCTIYVDTFRRNGIDGNTLMLLTSDFLVKTLGMRIGAAKFLTESVARRARDLQKLVPCDYCRLKNKG